MTRRGRSNNHYHTNNTMAQEVLPPPSASPVFSDWGNNSRMCTGHCGWKVRLRMFFLIPLASSRSHQSTTRFLASIRSIHVQTKVGTWYKNHIKRGALRGQQTNFKTPTLHSRDIQLLGTDCWKWLHCVKPASSKQMLMPQILPTCTFRWATYGPHFRLLQTMG